MMPRLTLRARMLLLFCAIVGTLLIGTYLFVYSLFETGLQQTRFERLEDRARPLVALTQYPGGIQAMEALDLHRQYFEIFDSSGRSMHRSKTLGLLDLPHDNLTERTKTVFRTVPSPVGSIREVVIPITIEGQAAWFIVSEPTSTINTIEASFRKKFLLAWIASLFFTAVLARWYVARSLRPLGVLAQNVEQLTNRISGTGEYVLTPKLPVRNLHDELGRLATNFNVLFERVDLLVTQMRRFVSDAAHELRTPLAVLHGETQLVLTHPRPAEDYVHALSVMDDELATMGRIIEGLFTLSMADAGQLMLTQDKLHLDEVLEEACGIATPLAREKRIAIHKSHWVEAELRGDQTLLRQLFLILMENAIKYSPPDTVISVGLRRAEGQLTVSIEDQGIGIPEEHLPHIFERFYRAAPQTFGHKRSGGLGLSIADAIAKAHHGSIQCESADGTGSRFLVSLHI